MDQQNILTPNLNPPPAAVPLAEKKSKLKTVFLILGILLFIAAAAYLIIKILPKKSLVFKKTPFKKALITITYWGLFEPSSAMQAVIDDYQKEHPMVKIDYLQENLKLYRERLQAALERKEGPDIFRLHQSWVPMLGGLMSPIPSAIYNSATFETTFYPSVKDTLKYGGQYVAIPLMYDGLALFYNEDIFRSKSQSPPKTWGELKTLACELTVKDEQGKTRTAGVALGTTNNIDHWSDVLGLMMLQNGADLANPSLCARSSGIEGSESCFGKDALSFYTLFAGSQACSGESSDVGSVWNSLLPTSTYTFATGDLAMYFGPSWRVFDIKSINSNLNFKIVPVPQLPGGNIAWSSYWVEGVAKDSKYQAEAWEFLNYLSSPAVLQKLYQAESNLRLFGEPFPRVDMAEQLKAQPMVGPFIDQAPFARNWYLSSNTADNGINQQVIKYYEDAVNAVNAGGDALNALKTTTQGVSQVLTRYGLTR